MFGCYNLFDDLDTGVPGTGLIALRSQRQWR